MLGQYHYHSIFRKSIIAFGTLFNNIVVKRSDGDAYKTPIQYGPAAKYLAMIAAEPTPERQQMQINLPRLSFEIRGLNYDPARKLVPTQLTHTSPRVVEDDSDKQPVQYKTYLPVPYNLEVEMSIISKTQDDGLQILEQILPHFHPSINVSIVVVDETTEERDIAIVLNGVGYTDDYEGDYSQRRTLLWTLNFTIKTYLFGPVDAQKDIRKITLDYRTDIVKRPAELRYSAEVKSTKKPPVGRDEIDPKGDDYTVVQTFDDIYTGDNEFFSLDP